VALLAVSKTFGPEAVRAAHAAGQTAFGENYIQEAVDKMAALADLPLVWHCIGPIQSNKTRLVAEHFDWAHTVDRLKIAQRLSEQLPAHRAPLQVCLQVNIDGGPTKSGVAPSDALTLAREVAQLPNLVLRGLMTIPEPAPNFATALAVHRQAPRAVRPAVRGRPGAGHLVHGHDRRPGSRRPCRQHDGAGRHGYLRRTCPCGRARLISNLFGYRSCVCDASCKPLGPQDGDLFTQDSPWPPPPFSASVNPPSCPRVPARTPA
jgi:uncharacterized pyridoxal phosphate-containing UPF0001 family protein